MKKYSIFHPWIMSFYSPSLYRDVVSNWRGIGLGYVFLLLTITWVPILYKADVALNKAVDEELRPVAQQLPTITIKDGKASIDKPSPYEIHDSKGNILAIIDTSGKYTSLTGTSALFLLTQNTFYVQKHDNATSKDKKVEVFKYELSKVTHTTVIDKDISEKILHYFTTYFWLFLPFLVLVTFVYRVIQMAIYALFGLLFTVILHTTLSYKELLRLTAIAITPAIILSTVLDLFHVTFPYKLTVYFLLSMCYLFFGVSANKTTSGNSQR